MPKKSQINEYSDLSMNCLKTFGQAIACILAAVYDCYIVSFCHHSLVLGEFEAIRCLFSECLQETGSSL